jgi:hypothetical protein
MKFAQTQEAHEFLLSIYYYSLSILLLDLLDYVSQDRPLGIMGLNAPQTELLISPHVLLFVSCYHY